MPLDRGHAERYLILHKASCLHFREMPGERSRRHLGCRLEFSERIRAIRQGAKNLDSSRMREARGQFENCFDRLCSSPEDQAQCFDNFLGSTFVRPRGRPVFHAAANASASQQAARFQSAQVLAGSRHRQAHALGDSGYGLVWLPDQESECLQAFAVSQNTAGAPKRRLTRRRHEGESYPHTLQSVTNWSMQSFEEFEVLNRGFSICLGVGTSISRRRSAGSAVRYSVTVDAGIGQVYHEAFCRGNCNVRLHADARKHISRTRRGCSIDEHLINAGLSCKHCAFPISGCPAPHSLQSVTNWSTMRC